MDSNKAGIIQENNSGNEINEIANSLCFPAAQDTNSFAQSFISLK